MTLGAELMLIQNQKGFDGEGKDELLAARKPPHWREQAPGKLINLFLTILEH